MIQAPSLGHTPCHTPRTRPHLFPQPSVPDMEVETRSWCWTMSPRPSQTQNLQTKQRRKNQKRSWRSGGREQYAWWEAFELYWTLEIIYQTTTSGSHISHRVPLNFRASEHHLLACFQWHFHIDQATINLTFYFLSEHFWSFSNNKQTNAFYKQES